jgi:Uma2 family endonuclease
MLLSREETTPMPLLHAQLLSTVEEYLALERASEERHEYLDGQIYAMAGESLAHGDICANLVITLGVQLRGSPCRVLTKDTKVRSGPLPKPRQIFKGLFSYPDLVIVCGELQFHDHYRDVLLNPTVIIEVLSPNTEAFDRGEKFRRYRLFNPSLSDYVLVAQDQPLIEHFVRQNQDQWLLAASVSELSGRMTLASIQCTLQLAEVYDRLVFPADVQPQADEA